MASRGKTTNEVAAVRAAEQALYRAMIEKDFAAVERLLAKNHLYVHSTAVAESKSQYLKEIKRNLYDYKSVKTRRVKIHVHGNAALTTGIAAMAVSTAGGPVLMIHFQFALVWEKQRGQWKLLLRQATRIPDKSAAA